MPIDLRSDLIQAFRDPAVGKALREALAVHHDVAAAVAAQGDPLLSIAAAAKHIGLTAGAFRQRLASDATLDDLRIGKGRLSRFRRSDLDRWVADARPGKRRGPAPKGKR